MASHEHVLLALAQNEVMRRQLDHIRGFLGLPTPAKPPASWFEVHRLCAGLLQQGKDLDDDLHPTFFEIMLTLDEVALLEIWERTRNPTPWLPFLVVLVRAKHVAPGPARDAAESHVRDVAMGLLRVQGQSVVSIDELLGFEQAE